MYKPTPIPFLLGTDFGIANTKTVANLLEYPYFLVPDRKQDLLSRMRLFCRERMVQYHPNIYMLLETGTAARYKVYVGMEMCYQAIP